MRRTMLMIVFAASLSACVSNRVSLRTVDAAEARWRSGGIAGYGFKLRTSAFTLDARCEGADGAVEVEVRSNHTTKFGTCELNSKFAEGFGSMPALFSTVREERAERPSELKVKFNDKLGYPEVIGINYARWVTDHGVTYHVSDFRRLH